MSEKDKPLVTLTAIPTESRVLRVHFLHQQGGGPEQQWAEHLRTDQADAAGNQLGRGEATSTIYVEVLQPLYGLPWNNTTYGVCLGLKPRSIFLCYGGEEKTPGGNNIMWVHLSPLRYIERIKFALQVDLFGLKNGHEVQKYLHGEG